MLLCAMRYDICITKAIATRCYSMRKFHEWTHCIGTDIFKPKPFVPLNFNGLPILFILSDPILFLLHFISFHFHSLVSLVPTLIVIYFEKKFRVRMHPFFKFTNQIHLYSPHLISFIKRLNSV